MKNYSLSDFKKFLNEKKQDILLEYMGISLDADSFSNELFKIISAYVKHSIDSINKFYYKDQVNEKGMPICRFYSVVQKIELNKNNTSSEIYKYVKNISLFIYYYKEDFPFLQSYQMLSSLGLVYNSFVYTADKKLNITVPVNINDLNNSDMNEYIYSTCSHEIRHGYDFSKQGGKNTVSKAYKKSIKSMDDNPFEKTSLKGYQMLISHDIPWVYYHMDIDEIHAFQQEAFIKIKKGVDLEDIKEYKMFISTLNDYNKLKQYYIGDKAKKCPSLYKGSVEYISNEIMNITGLSPEKYFNLLDKNAKIMKRAIMRLKQVYYDTHNYSNGSFKNYSNKEIDNDYGFSRSSLMNAKYRGKPLHKRMYGIAKDYTQDAYNKLKNKFTPKKPERLPYE